MGTDAIEIHPFTPDDWRIYKAIRLRALKADPKSFGSHFEKENAYDDARWKESVSREDVVIFGVYHYGDIIGLTGVSVIKDEEKGNYAKFWGSWLEPSWRGKGVSEQLYNARFNWARARPDVNRVVISHRESNIASKKANQKHGFVFTHQQDHVWPDGVTEPECFYELLLE